MNHILENKLTNWLVIVILQRNMPTSRNPAVASVAAVFEGQYQYDTWH